MFVDEILGMCKTTYFQDEVIGGLPVFRKPRTCKCFFGGHLHEMFFHSKATFNYIHSLKTQIKTLVNLKSKKKDVMSITLTLQHVTDAHETNCGRNEENFVPRLGRETEIMVQLPW